MQFFGIEDIKDLSKASPTTIEWASGSNLRIGGQAYNVTSVLTLDTATDIDTGSIANNSFYYIYAVVVAGTVSLKYSLSKESPTGYSAYRRIGALSTDGSSNILDAQRGKSFQKCQEKNTGSNIISTGVVSTLTFNNLTIGKKYKVSNNLFVDSTTSAAGTKTFSARTLNGSDILRTVGKLNTNANNVEDTIYYDVPISRP